MNIVGISWPFLLTRPKIVAFRMVSPVSTRRKGMRPTIWAVPNNLWNGTVSSQVSNKQAQINWQIATPFDGLDKACSGGRSQCCANQQFQRRWYPLILLVANHQRGKVVRLFHNYGPQVLIKPSWWPGGNIMTPCSIRDSCRLPEDFKHLWPMIKWMLARRYGPKPLEIVRRHQVFVCWNAMKLTWPQERKSPM